MPRKTVDRATVVATANSMIAHLAKSGTKSDADKREAIIALTSSILLAGDSYKGFQYLEKPILTATGQVWDDTRVRFN